MPILSEGKEESHDNGQCLEFPVRNRKQLHRLANQKPSQWLNFWYQFFKHERTASFPFVILLAQISDRKTRHCIDLIINKDLNKSIKKF
jgi:hypothetical protein